MPFARISRIKGWEDFGFRFKEGNDETAWDDAHGIITFHYTEPLTWWMPMPRAMPRNLEAATSEARRLAEPGQGPKPRPSSPAATTTPTEARKRSSATSPGTTVPSGA